MRISAFAFHNDNDHCLILSSRLLPYKTELAEVFCHALGKFALHPKFPVLLRCLCFLSGNYCFLNKHLYLI